MKQLDRYIIREMAVPMLIGTLSFLMMFQANMLIALFKEYPMDRVPPRAILQLILLKSPYFLQMTLPIGMAIASSLTVARLVRESELTAMRAAGMAIRRVLRPVAMIGLVIAALNFVVVEYVQPPSEVRSRKLFEEVLLLSSMGAPQANVTLKVRDYSVNVRAVAPDGKDRLILSDVLLFQRRQDDEVVIVTAKSGWYREGTWRFIQPRMNVVRGNTLINARAIGDILIEEKISISEYLSNQPRQDEKSLRELWAFVQEGRRTQRDTKVVEIAFHNRIAIPITCLVFAITGPMTALWFARSGPFLGVFMSLVMVLMYYNGFVIFNEILGRNGWIPPILAAWAPNLLFLAAGLWALRRAE